MLLCCRVGVAFMLVAAAAAGLIFTVMICIVSKAWLNVHKHSRCGDEEEKQRRGYYAVDEDDPFLPRQTEVENRYGSLVGGSNPQPVYVASAAGQASAPSHQSLASTVPDDNSPPPAYDGHHMNYMHQGSSHAGGQYAGAHV
ncbi:PREDICTED: uncharacterized protein LOC106808853 isoform X2 [Priapulus caudatus]|uniref:Uncharacterized protein LOC106808853 isoform X2 n=1 Tax=Priapulus caudatus TaxID=37621 RepID=A0ABM1E4V5_PRICU|nr:PREDICTED: uncharacterized protein LOC106808853 isoform X2 [Priapulus caudatus]